MQNSGIRGPPVASQPCMVWCDGEAIAWLKGTRRSAASLELKVEATRVCSTPRQAVRRLSDFEAQTFAPC
jgi:hypothetical protein